MRQCACAGGEYVAVQQHDTGQRVVRADVQVHERAGAQRRIGACPDRERDVEAIGDERDGGIRDPVAAADVLCVDADEVQRAPLPGAGERRFAALRVDAPHPGATAPDA